jgi:hypothetical protein
VGQSLGLGFKVRVRGQRARWRECGGGGVGSGIGGKERGASLTSPNLPFTLHPPLDTLIPDLDPEPKPKL